jgi:hypothetical protein
MLTETEKIRIQEEEIFREEIKKNLLPIKTTRQKFFNFFNTSLGNWVLTSILVGLVSFSFNYFFDKSER